MSTETPMKRKRGRPPKAGSLSNQITSTMNINVNTSSSLSSPSAEFNSRLMVKRGFAPDVLNPSMKVSPSPRPRKKRRKDSTSSSTVSSTDFSPLQHSSMPNNLQNTAFALSGGASAGAGTGVNATAAYNNFIMTNTPLSQAINGSTFTPYNQINSKTLDNISMITHDNHNGIIMNSNGAGAGISGQAYMPIYNTPPSSSSSIKGQFQSNYWNSPTYLTQTPLSNSPGNSRGAAGQGSYLPANSFPTPTPSLRKTNSYTIGNSIKIDETSPKSKNNLLPAASIVGKKQKKKETTSPKPAKKSKQEQPQQSQSQPQQQQQTRETVEDLNSSNDFILKLMVDESGKAILSDDMFGTAPKVSREVDNQGGSESSELSMKKHSKSVIGIEKQHSEAESSIGLSIPQPAQPQRSKSDGSYNAKPKPSLDAVAEGVSSLTKNGVSNNSNTAPTTAPSSSNSLAEFSATFPPTTPKLKEVYLQSVTSSGFTPNINLAYNLTPQFNSLMYSMMNNSPQIIAGGNGNGHQSKKSINGTQLFTNSQELSADVPVTSDGSDDDEDVLRTVNLSDLMNLDASSAITNTGSSANHNSDNYNGKAVPSSTNAIALAQSYSTSSSSSSSVISSAVSSTFPPLSFSGGNYSMADSIHEDSGDARLALRKIIHVKRD